MTPTPPTVMSIAFSRRGLVILAVALLAVLALPTPGGPPSGDSTDGRGTGMATATAAAAPASEPGADEAAHGGTGADPADEAASRMASPFLRESGKFILGLLAFSQMFAVLRLVQGPTLADRVIALDFIGITCASMIGVYSIVVEEPLYLRAVIVLSLVSFLGTIGFALYCEKRGEP